MSTINLANIKLIVGLGNPGPKFSRTRHNIGAMTIERLQDVGTQNIEPFQSPPTLLIPTTFMNESGREVALHAKKSGIKPEEILVLHDDIDLEPGNWKYKAGGSAGGHNGLRSIIASLGSDQFARLRIGVGRPFPHKPMTPEEENAIAKYVLSPIPSADQIKIDQSIDEIVALLSGK